MFIQGGGAVRYLCQKRIQPRTNGANDEYRPIIDKTLGKTGVSGGFGQATKDMAYSRNHTDKIYWMLYPSVEDVLLACVAVVKGQSLLSAKGSHSSSWIHCM